MPNDIASQISDLFDLTQKVPSNTMIYLETSGLLLLCAMVAIFVFVKREFGLKFMPVMYGFCVYILFYMLFGSISSSFFTKLDTTNMPVDSVAYLNVLSLIPICACIVFGRFIAMIVLKKYYHDYCDTIGIGLGFALTEAALACFSTLVNYVLCSTINDMGLVAMANSFDDVELATKNIESLYSLITISPFAYIIAGLENIIYLVFHTEISILYYGIAKGDIKKPHMLSLIGITVLMYAPSTISSSGMIPKAAALAIELVIFAAVTVFCVRFHGKNYNDIPAYVNPNKKLKNNRMLKGNR